MRYRAHHQPGKRDTAHRGATVGHRPPVGFAPGAEGCTDEMGVGDMTQRAVFLDRDGVINRASVRDGRPYPPSGRGNWRFSRVCRKRLSG